MSTDDQQPGPLPWRAPNRGPGTSAPDPFAAPTPNRTGGGWNNPYRPAEGPYRGSAFGAPQPGGPQPGAGQPGNPGPGQPGPLGPHGPWQPGGGPQGPHGPWQPGGGPQGPDEPRDDIGRGGRRRRPTWVALVGTAAGAALLASVGTASLTGTFDGTTAGSPTSTTQSGSRENSAPVVTSTTKNPDWANVADAVRPTVVAITVQTGQGTAQGSGVIIDAQGHIVTNHHVVGDAADGGIQVTLSDGRIYPASVEGTDPATDLAVITLKDPPKDLHAATLGNSDDVVVGDPVAAVGNPLGLSSTVTTGIVSALDRPVQTSEQTQRSGQQGVQVVTNAIQIDAAINPGNSGGPLFDATGRVIGINSSIASIPNASGQAGSIGLGFAIPSNLVKQISEQLIKDGVAQHAFLGVTMKDGTASADGATRAGAEVQAVQPGTPAADAGLQPGDVIVAINGDPVDGALSLTGFVRQYASGDKVTLTVVRGGKSLEVPATLVAKEDQKI